MKPTSSPVCHMGLNPKGVVKIIWLGPSFMCKWSGGHRYVNTSGMSEPGGPEGPCSHFGRLDNPISIRGDRLCPPNYYSSRIFRPSYGPDTLLVAISNRLRSRNTYLYVHDAAEMLLWNIFDCLWCCCLDVLSGQPIKLIQVFSTSEFHEYWWKNKVFICFVPSTLCRASEASNIDCFKNWVWKLLTKNLNSLLKNRYFGALIFQEREFFDH